MQTRNPLRMMTMRVLALTIVAALVISLVPSQTALAQDDETTPVLIVPVNQANFLPNALFDFRVEAHAEELPEDFAITINGEDASEFFGAEATTDSYTFGADEESGDAGTPSQSTTYRDVSFGEPGTYEVVVTADGNETTATYTVRELAEAAGAQNVILFIADGAAQNVYTAARLISRGQDQGTYNSNLVFEDFEEIGFLHTSGIDSIITDSANSASSYNTGHKTAVNANGVYPDTTEQIFDDPRTEKFAYMIKRAQDKAVGIVTTSNWSDATSNGVAGYGRDRSNEALNGYVTQPLDLELFPEVILGGGARNMLPQSAEGSRRDDDRDVFAEYEAAGYTVVTTGEELTSLIPAAVAVAMTNSVEMTDSMEVTDSMEMTDSVEMTDTDGMTVTNQEGERSDVDATAMEESIVTDTEGVTVTTALTASDAVTEGDVMTSATPERLIGIFHPNHMDVWLDKNVFTDNVAEFPDQPNLDVMVLAALEVLGQNENGFYLEVEGASVDKALHPMDFDRALADMIEFERSVAAAVQWAEQNAPDTLIIVTSDHAQGYDVYGTVDVEAFNAAEDDNGKRDAIGIYSDAGFPTYEDANGDFFPDDWAPSIVLAQGKVDNPFFTEDFQVSPVYRTPSINDEEGNTIDNPDDDPNGLPLGGNLPNGATSSVHTLQSVPVYAHGPGSECLGRSQENTEVFFCMAAAIGLNLEPTDGSLGGEMEAAAEAEAMAAAEEAEAAAPAEGEGNTIVDVAVGTDGFSTLVTAVTEAGLAETLSGEGPFTVFAPTDDAFAAIDPATLDAALADPDGLLTDVLLNHVVEGAVLSSDLSDGQEITTLGGGTLTVTIDGDTVMIGDATVVMADVEASNGVIHAIDTVLLP